MSLGDEQWNCLPAESRETLRAWVDAVTAIFGARLRAVLLYGSAARGEFLPGRSNLNLLVLLDGEELDALARYGRQHRRWAREGIVAPLVMTEEELRASVDLYPLEHLELREHHLVLSGQDPVTQADPDPRRLAAACAQGIRSNLLRLRQRYLEGGATADAVEILLPLSITALLPCLRGLAYLRGKPAPRTTDAFLGAFAAELGLDGRALLEAWQLKAGVSSPGKAELPRLFGRYLATVEELAARALDRSGGAS